MAEELNYICPNCNTENLSAANYCIQCGQKKVILKVKIWEFLIEFADSVFNIDNKFFWTLKNVFVPARLTKEYFEGVRKKYYHPLRIYFVSVIIFFFVLSFLETGDILQVNGTNDIGGIIEKRSELDDQKQIIKSSMDSFQMEHIGEPGIDLLDSLYKELYFVLDSSKFKFTDTLPVGKINLKFLFDSLELTNHELFVQDIDEVIESKGINTWYQRLTLRQILKGSRDIGLFNKFLFANLTWLFLALIPVFAIIMKLFYLRRKRYFIEHLVFLLHLFTALILSSSFLLTIYILFESSQAVILPILVILMFVFPLIAFRVYYKQSWIKTILKFFIIGFSFMVSFILCFVMFLMVTAALF